MSTLNIRRFCRKAESTAVMLERLNIRRFWVFHYMVTYYVMENPKTADIQPFQHNGVDLAFLPKRRIFRVDIRYSR